MKFTPEQRAEYSRKRAVYLQSIDCIDELLGKLLIDGYHDFYHYDKDRDFLQYLRRRVEDMKRYREEREEELPSDRVVVLVTRQGGSCPLCTQRMDPAFYTEEQIACLNCIKDIVNGEEERDES